MAVLGGTVLLYAATVGPTTTSTPVPATGTDWSRNLTFAQFDPTLGTLTSVQLKFSTTLSTTLTVTNNALVSSRGTARTEVQVGVQDTGNNLADLTGGGTGELDVLSTGFVYGTVGSPLAAGATITSGTLAGTGSSDTTYTAAAILSEFTGFSTINLAASTTTGTVLSNTGGNTTATQFTTASATGNVTYTYTPGDVPPHLSSVSV